MRRLLAGTAGAVALAAAVPATPHSLLLESSPAAGAVVPPPPRVELRFNNRIEVQLSRVRIVDERGERHDLALSPDGRSPDRLSAPAPRLGPGPYRVEWQVLSTDGHVVNGRYSFRVAP